MAATLATFAGVLQHFYLKGVNRQINDEVMILSEVKKKEMGWDGDTIKIHAWTQRNNGVGASDGTLPTAGQQRSVQLTVPHINFYGTFQLDGDVIASAPKQGKHAFVNWAEFEMEGLAKDVKDRMNLDTVSGSFTKGYLNQHKAQPLAQAPQTVATILVDASAAETWEYSGDFTPFLDAVAGTPATWVPVSLIRQDTFNPVDLVPLVGLPTNPNIFVVSADSAAGTLDIRFSCDNGSGAEGFTTATVADGRAIAVVLRDAQATDNGGEDLGAAPNTGVGGPRFQATGIFHNLSSPVHYGIARNSPDPLAVPAVLATGQEEPILQCNVRTMSTTGAHDRIAPTIPRMERMFNLVDLASGRRATSLWVNPLFQSVYVQLGIGVINVDGQKAKNLDVGFKENGYAFGGCKLRTSRHIPQGLVIYFYLPDWITACKGKGKFANMDGSVFDRVDGFDAWKGYWRKYYNLVCKRPNSQMILVGLNYN